MSYKAFISYSHAADGTLAPALQSALHQFAKPFYQLRAIRVFRDKTSLHLTPELWPLIQSAMRQSEWFLLLASPDAAQSAWVQMEVSEWMKLKSGTVDRLLIVLTEGEIVWDSASNDFDWRVTNALPVNLKAIFKREPFYCDLRWARKSTDVSLRNPQFLDDVGTLAAALHGKSKDEMLGNDVRQHRVFKTVTAAVGVVLLVLAVGATGAAIYANRQRLQAERESRIAFSRELASSASAQLDIDPERGLLLSLEAHERTPTAESEAALRRALLASRVRHTIQHISWVANAAFSSDGRWLLVDRGSSHVLEVGTWREAAKLDGGNAVFRPDGHTILTHDSPIGGGTQHVLRTFDSGSWRVTGEWRRTMPHDDRLTVSPDGRLLLDFLYRKATMSLLNDPGATLWADDAFNARWAIFSPNGKFLVTAYRDGPDDEARVLDAATGRLVHDLGKPVWTNAEAVFSADSRYVAVAYWTDVARVFELATGKTVATLNGHTGTIDHLAFSPDGKSFVTASSDRTARVWDTGAWTQVAELKGHSGGVKTASFSTDGTTLVTTSSDGSARVWDTGSWDSIVVLNGHRDSLLGAAVSPDGNYVATRSQDSTARVWEVSGGQEVVALEASPEIGYGAFFPMPFSPDGKLVAVRNAGAKTVDVYDTKRWRRIAGLDTFSVFGFAPDGRSLFTIARGGTIERWDTFTWRKTADLKGHEAERPDVLSIAFSADGRWFVTSGGYDKTARVWQAKTSETAAVLSGHEGRVMRAVFSPDSKWVATASYDGTVRITETGSWKSATVLRVSTEDLNDVMFSSDGTRLLASGDRQTRVFETDSWKPVATLSGQNALFSPDARRLVTFGMAPSTGLWDAKSGQLIARFDDWPRFAAFSHDGAFLVTVKDTAAQVREAATGKIVVAIDVVPPGGVPGSGQRELTAAAFSTDGEWLLFTCNDNVTRILPRERFAPVDELVALARTRVTRALTTEEHIKYLHETGMAAPTRTTPPHDR